MNIKEVGIVGVAGAAAVTEGTPIEDGRMRPLMVVINLETAREARADKRLALPSKRNSRQCTFTGGNWDLVDGHKCAKTAHPQKVADQRPERVVGVEECSHT
eukprot:6689372-Prymnesium_polylepis.2